MDAHNETCPRTVEDVLPSELGICVISWISGGSLRPQRRRKRESHCHIGCSVFQPPPRKSGAGGNTHHIQGVLTSKSAPYSFNSFRIRNEPFHNTWLCQDLETEESSSLGNRSGHRCKLTGFLCKKFVPASYLIPVALFWSPPDDNKHLGTLQLLTAQEATCCSSLLRHESHLECSPSGNNTQPLRIHLCGKDKVSIEGEAAGSMQRKQRCSFARPKPKFQNFPNAHTIVETEIKPTQRVPYVPPTRLALPNLGLNVESRWLLVSVPEL